MMRIMSHRSWYEDIVDAEIPVMWEIEEVSKTVWFAARKHWWSDLPMTCELTAKCTATKVAWVDVSFVATGPLWRSPPRCCWLLGAVADVR